MNAIAKMHEKKYGVEQVTWYVENTGFTYDPEYGTCSWFKNTPVFSSFDKAVEFAVPLQNDSIKYRIVERKFTLYRSGSQTVLTWTTVDDLLTTNYFSSKL